MESNAERWTKRYFACAENPVKYWLSVYHKQGPLDLFEDYQDLAHAVAVEHNGTFYSFRLFCGAIDDDDSTTHFGVPDKVFKSSEQMKQTVSMLYDAVMTVWGALNLAYPGGLLHLRPEFDEYKMRFGLIRFNSSQHKLDYATKNAEQMKARIAELEAAVPRDVEAIGEAYEIRRRLVEMRDSVREVDLDGGRKVVAACEHRNGKAPYLYVRVEETTRESLIHSKLPKLPAVVESDSESESEGGSESESESGSESGSESDSDSDSDSDGGSEGAESSDGSVVDGCETDCGCDCPREFECESDCECSMPDLVPIDSGEESGAESERSAMAELVEDELEEAARVASELAAE